MPLIPPEIIRKKNPWMWPPRPARPGQKVPKYEKGIRYSKGYGIKDDPLSNAQFRHLHELLAEARAMIGDMRLSPAIVTRYGHPGEIGETGLSSALQMYVKVTLQVPPGEIEDAVEKVKFEDWDLSGVNEERGLVLVHKYLKAEGDGFEWVKNQMLWFREQGWQVANVETSPVLEARLREWLTNG